MDFQVAFNIFVGLSGFLAGYVLFSIKESISNLISADKDLTEKLQAIEVLVAGKYVTREDLQKMGTDIFNMLRRIEEKLDKKVDK